jgi:hypothetical protein
MVGFHSVKANELLRRLALYVETISLEFVFPLPIPGGRALVDVESLVRFCLLGVLLVGCLDVEDAELLELLEELELGRVGSTSTAKLAELEGVDLLEGGET